MSGSYHGGSDVGSWRPRIAAKRAARARKPYASSGRRLFGIGLVNRRPAIFPSRKGGGKRKRGSRGGRKSRKGRKKRGGMSARTIIDKIVPTQIWTTIIAQHFSCPTTLLNSPGQLYFIPAARVRGVTPTIDLNGGSSYPLHHLMEMLYLAGSGATGGTLDGKLVVHNYAHKHTIVNMSNGQTKLTRYTLVAREDVVVLTGLTDPVAMMTTSDWATNNTANNDFALTPYDQPTLTTYFKIVGVKHRTLSPGEQVVDLLKSGKRRMFNATRYAIPTDNTTTYRTVPVCYKYVKNTRLFMYRLQGQLADTASLAGNVTYTNPAVNITTEYRYHFKLQQPFNHTTFNDGIQGLAASAGVAHFIEVQTGADVADLAD